jgi:hypothetical protein
MRVFFESIDTRADNRVENGLPFRTAGVENADKLAIPQHCHAIGDVTHLVNVVGDDDHRSTCFDDGANEGKQPLHVLCRKKGRGLIQNQYALTTIARIRSPKVFEGADDGDERPLHRWQVRHRLEGVYRQIEFCKQFGDGRRFFFPIDEPWRFLTKRFLISIGSSGSGIF